MSIGKKIKELRISQGMIQKEVYSRLSIPNNTYSNYENDKRDPDYETLVKIANFFNVSTDYLLGYENNEDAYEKEVCSINVQYMIKLRIIIDQIPENLDNYIKKLFQEIDSYFNSDEKLVRGYSQGSMYYKVYNWLQGIELPTDTEATFLAKAFDLYIDVTDDHIDNNVLSVNTSEKGIEEDAKERNISKYEVALGLEREIRLGIKREENNLLKLEQYRIKLFDLEPILKKYDKELHYNSEYERIIKSLKENADLYKNLFILKGNEDAPYEAKEILKAMQKMTKDERERLLLICKVTFPEYFIQNNDAYMYSEKK